MFKMEFIRGCPGVPGGARRSPAEPGGARRNGVRDVETEPHQQRVMARITAVKQTPSNELGADEPAAGCGGLTRPLRASGDTVGSDWVCHEGCWERRGVLTCDYKLQAVLEGTISEAEPEPEHS